MQDAVTNTLWIIYAGSVILFVFCVGFIALLVYSHRHKLRLQQEKLAEIQRSELNYRTLFHNSLAGMIKFQYDPFEILDANQALLDIFVCTSIGSLADLFEQKLPAHLTSIVAALDGHGILEEYEVSFVDTNNRRHWLLVSVKSEHQEKIAYGVFRDITRRKEDQEKIEEQAALLNKTRDSVVVMTLEGEILFWNDASADMYGWKSAEVLGKKIGLLLFSGDTRDQYRICMEDVENFGEWTGEQTHRGKKIRPILVESVWQRIDNQYRNTSAVLIVNTDITEKRALETSRLYNQKMEAIALMTGGIAHDLQNILAPVLLSLSILRDKLPGSSGERLFETMEDSMNSGLRLVKNILMVGKGISGMKKRIDLARTLDASVRTCLNTMPQSISVEKQYARDPLMILGDESLLNQVFLNLFQNAKEAMADGGTLSIALRRLDPDRDSAYVEYEDNGEAYALITISDTGSGIPHDHLEKIFTPFFTTKEGTGGTGLGLPIVKNIINTHGGSITAHSQAHNGSTFFVALPLDTEHEST
ncbi:MAG TPA: ATP-binding protein [Bacteroidota bacterium]|nr:ATP-binding protein [Bacteroidota bacterium]